MLNFCNYFYGIFKKIIFYKFLFIAVQMQEKYFAADMMLPLAV